MSEHTSLIEIDEAKFAKHFDEDMTTVKIENNIARMLTGGDGDPVSRDGIAAMLGADGDEGYDKYAEVDGYAEIEEQCERHPEEWFAITPTSMARCWRCQSEKRSVTQ